MNNKKFTIGIVLISIGMLVLAVNYLAFDVYNIGLAEARSDVSLSQMSNNEDSSMVATQLITENKAWYTVEWMFWFVSTSFIVIGLVFVAWSIYLLLKNKETE